MTHENVNNYKWNSTYQIFKTNQKNYHIIAVFKFKLTFQISHIKGAVKLRPGGALKNGVMFAIISWSFDFKVN